jgi:predicted nuclease of predicted toxin-antitoxin system
VKLLVDMNLSPSWVGQLAQRGFDAVHWSTIGAATSPDEEILSWARENGFVVLTNDLDFSAILAATSGAESKAPCSISSRCPSSALVTTLTDVSESRSSIDEGGARIRMLPLRRQSDEL